MKVSWSNTTQGILEHAERDGDEKSIITSRDPAYLARVADKVANIWLPESEGYTEQQRLLYRAGWFHAMRKKRGV